MIQVKEVVPEVFHLDFQDRRSLASTLLRFQEHYESPEFRGKVFTLDQYKAWYIANSPKGSRATGEFTYYDDWSGFNFPSHVLDPFFDGFFDPLDQQEQVIVEMFRGRRGSKFYVIGTFGGNTSTLKHETSHGLFYTRPDYRAEVLAIVMDISPEGRKKLERFLANSAGYHQDVWEDEIHAHLMASPEKLKRHGVDSDMFIDFTRRLNEVFDQYAIPNVYVEKPKQLPENPL